MSGKPVLGAVSGLFFGLFLALLLQQWAIYPLTALSVFGLPVLGLLFGLILAAWAPFGGSAQKTTEPKNAPADDSGTVS